MSRRHHRRNASRPGAGRRFAAAISVLLVLLLAAIWVVMQVPGEDWSVGAAFVYAPKLQWIALPVLGLIFALIARSSRLVLLNLAATAFAVFVLAGLQLNTPAPIPEDRPIIRLATWNVHGLTRDRERIQERIMSWDADIVCMQESGGRVFADLLPGYESAQVGPLRVYARGRILRDEAPPPPTGSLPRFQIVEVELDAGPVTVINAHIPRGEAMPRTPRRPEPLLEYIEAGVQLRELNFDQLLDELPDGPLVLAGDLNITPASQFYAQIAAHLTDSFTEVGRGFGITFVWRRQYPTLRIDYVWTGGGVDPLRFETQHHLPSDHRPIITELALPRAPATDEPQ